MTARQLLGAICALTLIGIGACDKEHAPTELTTPADATPLFDEVLPADFADNPTDPDVPAATVAIEEFATTATLMNSEPAGSISPTTLTAVLQAGESVTETKIVTTVAGLLPPRADILFAFDLTGSMGGELNNVKSNSTSIMNAIRAQIPFSNFGVVSHMDYDGIFGGCGYPTQRYGQLIPNGDYPYSLDQPFTATTTDVTNAINLLTLGWGADGPENYTRVMYEAYSDANIVWQTDAARFLVYWQDAIPHDCAYNACLGGISTTGPDPGRNNVVDDGGDDLVLATTLAGLAAANISLVALHSGGNLTLWDCYAGSGGGAFQINGDGTIPDGTDIADFIIDKIEEVFDHVDVLELEASSGYESWLTSNTTYGPILLSDEGPFEFPIEITVPGGTLPGIYNFQVCAVADGATLAICQDVMIVVYDPSGGFVTGGGWIDSPAGAYVPDDLLVGKATFGFVSKYKKGASTPMGSTEFQFHAAGMNFHSSSYQWLVVTGQGDYAKFKGEGTVNGGTCEVDGPYKFQLWAGDDDPDTFRIKIWCEDEFGVETDLYDNGFDQAISAGNIVIHKK